MNIVLVMDQYDNSNNGTTVTARRLAQSLQAAGHTVKILAGGAPEEGKLCAKRHTIPFFQKLIESQGMCFAKPDPALYYEAFKDADIVHFFMPFRFCREGERHARQMRVPCVAGFHVQPENITSTLFLNKSAFVNRWLYRWFFKVFFNRFDYIHCPSAFIASQLEAQNYGAQLHVISNGVAKEFVRCPAQRPAEWEGRFVILMVGRLSREKRQDLIINAAKLSRYAGKIQLVFAGKGPRAWRLRLLARKLPHKLEIGFYSQQELIRLMNICDLYIHASDAEIEGISCMEALACGMVPVISDSPLSATGQYALHENCLFKAGDKNDLAAKIDYWMEHPEEKAVLSKQYAAQQDANRVEACTAQMLEMYRLAIDKVRRGGYRQVKPGGFVRHTTPAPQGRNKILQEGKASALRGVAWLSAAIAALLLPLHKLLFGLRFEGREHIKALQGGAVTVCNHVHTLDSTMVKAALSPRRLWLVSLPENFEMPFIGHLIRALGAVSLGSGASEQAGLTRALAHRITQGELVHFFAEGMLVPYYPRLREMHGGAFSMAVRTGCPVLPMVLRGQKRGGLYRLKRRPCLTLRVLPPVYPSAGLHPKRAAEDLQRRVEAAMRAALGEAPLASAPPEQKTA